MKISSMESSTSQTPSKRQKNSPEDEMMDLYFKVRKTIAMKVKKSETIENLKVMLREKEGISEDLQVLSFNGQELLHDSNRIMDEDIAMNSTICLQEHSQKKLIFKTPSNEKSFELEVMTFYSFHRIKAIIRSKVGIHPHEYTLYYAGKHVPIFWVVDSLNIKGAEATIQMMANRNDILSFLVETPTQNTIEVEIKCNHTVLTLKSVIESMTNCPSEDWDLFSGSTRLRNAKTLAYYEIKENDILKMLPALYQISVRTRTGKLVTLEVRQSNTIRSMKEKYFQQTGIPVNRQRLTFGGQMLEDNKDLAHYSIEDGFTLRELTR